MKTTSTLLEFSEHATSCRDAFFQDLEHLPESLRDVVVDNYNERVKRCNGKPLLGEYVPWLLADMVPVKNRDVLPRIASAWLGLYTYTIFMDDLLDITGKPDAGPLLLASGLILQRGLSSLYQVLPSGDVDRAGVSRFWIAAADAVLRELQDHKGKLSSYGDGEINRLGEKVSLLSMCASCILVADGYEDINDGVLRPVEAFATGMQLLDDMTDWEEDWRSGNFTHILTRTFRALGVKEADLASASTKMTSLEVLTAIVATGSLEDCLSRGIQYIEDVLRAPGCRSGSPALRLLQEINEEHAVFFEEVQAARELCWKERPLDWPSGELHRLSDTPVVREAIREVERKIKIVAQHT